MPDPDIPSPAQGQPGSGSEIPPGFAALLDSIVHRLRTPLTAVKGWNELARRQAGEASDVGQLLARSHAAIREMERAIAEIDAERARGYGARPGSNVGDPLSDSLQRNDIRPPGGAEDTRA